MMIKHSPKNRPPMTDELREKGKKRNKRLRRELNVIKGTKLYDDIKRLRESPPD